MSYSTSEISEITGYNITMVSHYLRRSGIKPVGKIDKNELIWEDECLDIIFNRVEEVKKKKELFELSHKPEPEKVDKEEDHPLVTDKRCLRMNYWPEMMPMGYENE